MVLNQQVTIGQFVAFNSYIGMLVWPMMACGDCINTCADDNGVENLPVLLEAASRASIPVYGSEVEQVKNGCLASVSIDYVALGKVTGEMGLEVMKGTNPGSIAVRTISDATPVINTDVASALGMTIPESFGNAELVTTNH